VLRERKPLLLPHPQSRQYIHQFLRQRRFKSTRLRLAGQNDFQLRGVQKMTVNFQRRRLAAINLIPHNRTAEEGAMQADLVRAPGMRTEFEQGVMAEFFERLVFAD